MTPFFTAVALFALLALLVVAVGHDIELRRRDAWLRDQVSQIGLVCSDFPQAREIADRLSLARTSRTPIDLKMLRRALAEIERKHDAHIIEQTRHWSALQAKAAAEAAMGEPLPGFEGGAQ